MKTSHTNKARYLLLAGLLFTANATGQTTPAPAEDSELLIDPPQTLCPTCDEHELLIVNLTYYLQILKLLTAIEQEKKDINTADLDAIRPMLLNLQPDLAALHKKPATKPTTKKPAKTAQKPKQETEDKTINPQPVTRAKTPAPTGIVGLRIAHVNEANEETNTRASIVVISNSRPYSKTLNETITHNGRDYRITEVNYIEDATAGNRHEVKILDIKSKKTFTIPWQ